MGLVVDSVIQRARADLGRTYHWTDWTTCCKDLGLGVMVTGEINRPAYLFLGHVFLRSDLPPYVMAYYAWEEIGHFLTGVGNREFWRHCLPGMQGELNVARFERWAAGVRRELPEWDDDPAIF